MQGYGKLTFLWGITGTSLEDYLISAGEMIPDQLIQDAISGRAGTVIKLNLGLVTWGLA